MKSLQIHPSSPEPDLLLVSRASFKHTIYKSNSTSHSHIRTTYSEKIIELCVCQVETFTSFKHISENKEYCSFWCAFKHEGHICPALYFVEAQIIHVNVIIWVWAFWSSNVTTRFHPNMWLEIKERHWKKKKKTPDKLNLKLKLSLSTCL